MMPALPSRIMNYSVSSSSPTEELMTVGRILSEVGEYASTILDREYLSISRKCLTRYNKIVDELISRRCIKSADDLYGLPQSYPMGSDLARLTIAELHNLYRNWPLRHKERESEGRENFTFYYEGRIVRELKRRKTVNKAEQLKIDYCVATYHNELDKMSFVFSRPVQIDNDKIYPDRDRAYTPDELTALIRLYKDYRDITEREIFVEYVDYALDLLTHIKDSVACLSLSPAKDSASCLKLLSEIAEVGRRKVIRIPTWVKDKLEEAVNRCIASKTTNDVDLSMAMLTLQTINGDSTLERKAKRIINRCYKSAFDDSLELCDRIENLHTAVTCCDYVSRFSASKVATLWNELNSRISSEKESGCQALSWNGLKDRPISEKEADSRELLSYRERLGCKEATSKHIFQLLEIVGICWSCASISAESKEALKRSLNEMAQSDDTGAKAYNKIVRQGF